MGYIIHPTKMPQNVGSNLNNPNLGTISLSQQIYIEVNKLQKATHQHKHTKKKIKRERERKEREKGIENKIGKEIKQTPDKFAKARVAPQSSARERSEPERSACPSLLPRSFVWDKLA